MKRFTYIKAISEKISEIAESSTLTWLKAKELKGKEEALTANMEVLIEQIVEKTEKELNSISLSDVQLKVTTFRKAIEKHIGADLAIILKVALNDKVLKKGILVQAKVGDINTKKGNYHTSNKDILRQAEAMKKITSSSYFFLYTKDGIKVFSGLNIWLQNDNCINSKDLHFQSFYNFIREFLECFIGDEKFIEDMPDDNLEEYLRDGLKVRNLLFLEISPKI